MLLERALCNGTQAESKPGYCPPKPALSLLHQQASAATLLCGIRRKGDIRVADALDCAAWCVLKDAMF
jgi:hypothetical protein